MNVYVAGQIYTIVSFVLILSGTLALNRRLFGHWSVLPLIAFPLLYNNIFLIGTMNYVFGIGLSLWALVVWVWLRERAMASPTGGGGTSRKPVRQVPVRDPGQRAKPSVRRRNAPQAKPGDPYALGRPQKLQQWWQSRLRADLCDSYLHR